MSSVYVVPTLQRGNAASDAPASRNAGALPDEFPRRSVTAIKLSIYRFKSTVFSVAYGS